MKTKISTQTELSIPSIIFDARYGADPSPYHQHSCRSYRRQSCIAAHTSSGVLWPSWNSALHYHLYIILCKYLSFFLLSRRALPGCGQDADAGELYRAQLPPRHTDCYLQGMPFLSFWWSGSLSTNFITTHARIDWRYPGHICWSWSSYLSPHPHLSYRLDGVWAACSSSYSSCGLSSYCCRVKRTIYIYMIHFYANMHMALDSCTCPWLNFTFNKLFGWIFYSSQPI